MKKLLALATFAAVALTTSAAPPPPYYVAGDFNGWNAAGSVMTETAPNSGIWQVSLSNISGRHEFKITEGDWGWNYPGPNSWFYAPASGNITITYDVNTYSDGWLAQSQRIGLNIDPGSWTVAGDFQGWNNAAGNMILIGGGIYEYQAILAPGTHSWKAVVTGTWDSISLDNRSVGTANYDFTVVAGAELCTFHVDALKGTVKLDMAAVPEPSVFTLLGAGIGFIGLRRRH